MQNIIYNIRTTKEALQDLESLVNRAKYEGLINVQAKLNESEQAFEITLTYQEGNTCYDRHISIKLE